GRPRGGVGEGGRQIPCVNRIWDKAACFQREPWSIGLGTLTRQAPRLAAQTLTVVPTGVPDPAARRAAVLVKPACGPRSWRVERASTPPLSSLFAPAGPMLSTRNRHEIGTDIDVDVVHVGVSHGAARVMVGDQPLHDRALAGTGVEVHGIAARVSRRPPG